MPKVHFNANHIDIKFTTFNFRLYSGLAIHIEVYHYGKESGVKYSMTPHFLIMSPALVTFPYSRYASELVDFMLRS